MQDVGRSGRALASVFLLGGDLCDVSCTVAAAHAVAIGRARVCCAAAGMLTNEEQKQSEGLLWARRRATVPTLSQIRWNDTVYQRYR